MLIIVAVAAVYLLVERRPFDKPQPVAMGETQVQTIRDEDGNIERWTYAKSEMSRTPQLEVVAVAAAPPTGAADLFNEQALNAWNRGDIRAALSLFEDAIAADPNDPTPHSNYGRRLTVMVAYDEALPLLSRATELSPDDPQVWLDMLTLYDKTLQFQQANLVRQRARALAGGREFVRNDQGAWLLDGTRLP